MAIKHVELTRGTAVGDLRTFSVTFPPFALQRSFLMAIYQESEYVDLR